MRREIGQQIVDLVKQIDGLVHQIYLLSEEMDDEAQARKIRGGLADVVHYSHLNVTMTVVKQFPEMHPHKEVGPDGALRWKDLSGDS